MAGGNYDVYFPEKQVGVGSRYLFFNSLYSSPGNAPGLGGEAAGIIGDGIAALHKGNNQSKAQNEWSIIKQSLEFLRVLAERSRNDQQRWLQEHFINNPALKEMPELQANFQEFMNSLSSGEDFPYIKFIRYFNICLSGLERYKQNCDYEYARLQELQTAWDQIDALNKKDLTMRRRNAKKELAEAGEQITEESIQAKLFSTYIQQQMHLAETEERTQHYAKILSSKTMVNKVSSYLNSVFKKIWSDANYQAMLKQKLANMFKNKAAALTLTKESLGILLAEFSAVTTPMLNDIIDTAHKEIKESEEVSRNHVRDSILLKMEKYIDDYVLASKNNTAPTLQQIQMQGIESRLLALAKDVEQAQNIQKRIFTELKVTPHKRPTRRTITGLIQEAVDIIKDDFRQRRIALQNYGNKYTSDSGKIKETIRRIIYAQDKQNNPNIKGYSSYRDTISYTAIAKQLNDILTRNHSVTIHFNGKNNAESEIIANTDLSNVMHESLKSAFPASGSGMTATYAKSDNALIELGEFTVSTLIGSKVIKEMCDTIIQEMSFAIHGDGKKNTKSKITENAIKLEKSLRKSHGFAPTEFFMQGETKKRVKQYQDFIKQMENQAKRKGSRGAAAREALKALQNSFKISTSVKSYDKYNNKLGFVGGSLGSQQNLDHQLENILFMFQTGGITGLDKDWLLFAVYNAGKVLVGAPYKEKIEDILSIFAVSLMFDDAGEQAQYIKQSLGNEGVQTGPHFLHLYLLNGLYFPGSFILQLTYERLARVQGIINAEAKPLLSNGSAIKIINNVTYNDLAGEDRGWNRRVTVSPANWGQTFANGSPKVKLQITFLAGFLDILNALQDLSSPLQ